MEASGAHDEALVWAQAAAPGPAREQLASLASKIALGELSRRRAPPAELEDLAQEAVRSTLAFVGRGAPAPRDLEAFLKYRAWGVLSDYRKRLRAQPVLTTREPSLEPRDPARGPRETSQRRQLIDALADCRAALTPEQRETIELRYLAGLEGEAIAARLGVHRNTVHVRVHRALIALRECLERKGLAREDALE